MFGRVSDIVAEAGGSLDDIVKFSVRIAEAAARAKLNEQWCALFPDPSSRPARQVTVGTTRPHIQVQCEFVAVLGGGSTDGGNDA
jgi:2-iminobutanoate/2-iminopropanoate deaminase